MKNILSTIGIALFILTACNEKKEFTDKGSEMRTDLCNLLSKDLIISTFGLSATTEFDISDEDNICTYSWTGEDAKTYYSVSLNFARGGKKDAATAESIWESQNNGIYKDKDLQEVEGVGDKASWSTLGGGQLRVLADGEIFYVSLSIFMNDDAMTTEQMIEKTSTIAKVVIEKL